MVTVAEKGVHPKIFLMWLFLYVDVCFSSCESFCMLWCHSLSELQMYGGYCLGMRFECDVLMYGKYKHVTCFYGDTPPKFNIAPEK